MSKVLVLYYSAYGHIEAMANAVAEGARETGAKVDVKRVPETVPAEIAKAHHFKLDQAAPIASIDDLANYDAIVIGALQAVAVLSEVIKIFPLTITMHLLRRRLRQQGEQSGGRKK
jgi:multimeric flavodoxin WrbA